MIVGALYMYKALLLYYVIILNIINIDFFFQDLHKLIFFLIYVIIFL